MPAPGRRVVAIGLDAAEWTLVESLIDAGELPRLAALRERAAVARLRHADYRSGLVWEHFLRGRGVDGCGRASVVEFDPGDYSVTKLGALPEPPFFAGVDGRTICFDVPYVSLASVPDDTVAITAWGAHDPGYPRASLPPGLLTQIDELFAPHPAFDNDYAIVWHRPEAMDALAHTLVTGARHRAEISCWLLDRFPDWKLFVTVLSEPHSAAEQLWHGIAHDYPVGAVVDADIAEARLRDVYRAVDASVGLLVDALPPDATVVLFSMHGTGTNDADVVSMVLLPELLHRLHTGGPYLREVDTDAWAVEGFPLIVPPPDQSWDTALEAPPPTEPGGAGSARPGAPASGLRRLRRATSRARRPPSVRWACRSRARPATIRPRSVSRTTRSSGRWRRATAGGGPRCGRSRSRRSTTDGSGSTSRAASTPASSRAPSTSGRATRWRRSSASAATPARVSRSSPRSCRLRADDPLEAGGPDADLQIIWSRPSDAFTHPEAGTIGPFAFRRTGGHTPDGFAFVLGPGIEPADLGEHDALAVTATVAALAGADTDGIEAPPLPVPLAGTAD